MKFLRKYASENIISTHHYAAMIKFSHRLEILLYEILAFRV